jgi:hypothetical protein
MVNERFVSAIAAGFFLLAVFDFSIGPFLWTALLIVGLAGLLFREWPKLVLVCWDSLSNRRVQTVVAGLVVLSLWVDFSGFRGVLAAAQKSPENELGSYWELAGILINAPFTVVAVVVTTLTYMVTRGLMQQQNVTVLLQGILPRICPDGRTVDLAPVSTDLVTTQVMALINKSPIVCPPEALAELFLILNRSHALAVLDFNPTAGQHDVDDDGRPKRRVYCDPRKGSPSGQKRQGIRCVQLDELTRLLQGRAMRGFLRGVHFVYADFVRTAFDGSDLQDAVLVGSTFRGCSFRNSDCRGLKVMLAAQEYADAIAFRYTDSESRWYTLFRDCDFTGARMDPGLFRFLQKHGSGNCKILDAIICLEDGREISARDFETEQRSV